MWSSPTVKDLSLKEAVADLKPVHRNEISGGEGGGGVQTRDSVLAPQWSASQEKLPAAHPLCVLVRCSDVQGTRE